MKSLDGRQTLSLKQLLLCENTFSKSCVHGCYGKSISRPHFLLPVVEAARTFQKISGALLALLQMLTAGHCCPPRLGHNDLVCSPPSLWDHCWQHAWGVCFTPVGGCWAGEQPSWAATCLTDFPSAPENPACCTRLGEHLCKAAAACQSFELSLEEVLTGSAECSPSGAGSAQVAQVWLAQFHPPCADPL